MSDSAKGPLAGYIFQFEKALLELSKLENPSDYITIEEFDDVTSHEENNNVLISYQAKHSIASNGTTFEDTSYALWRTLQIWIQKLEDNIFNDETIFVCSTNKKIPSDYLIYRIRDTSFEDIISEFISILNAQKEKLSKKDPKSGTTIKQTIKLIEFVLKKKDVFQRVKKNIKIEDEEEVKEKFLNQLHLVSDSYTDLQRDNIYHTFNGWIISNSKARWKNDEIAKFTKENFNKKFGIINSVPSIVNAIFRTKESLGLINEKDIDKNRNELFVKQIEEIERRKKAKQTIIQDAILDFICCDIEVAYIINEKGDFTEEDFNEFKSKCFKAWEKSYNEIVIYELEDYSDKEKNDMAVAIFDTIMNKIKIDFQDTFCFNTSNMYIRNGSFLQLSNIPEIGWHPDWETKYKS